MENNNKPIKITVIGDDVARLNEIRKHVSESKESPADIIIMDSVPPKEEVYTLKPQIVPDDYNISQAKKIENIRTRRERNRKAWDRNRKKPF